MLQISEYIFKYNNSMNTYYIVIFGKRNASYIDFLMLLRLIKLFQRTNIITLICTLKLDAVNFIYIVLRPLTNAQNFWNILIW